MKNKILALGTLALVLATFGTMALTTQAYRGDPTMMGPNYSAERHEAMETAFANKDFTAWKNLMQGNGRVLDVINESNFAKFAEAHNLAKQGKFAEANAIRAELGLGVSGNGARGGGAGRGCNR